MDQIFTGMKDGLILLEVCVSNMTLIVHSSG